MMMMITCKNLKKHTQNAGACFVSTSSFVFHQLNTRFRLTSILLFTFTFFGIQWRGAQLFSVMEWPKPMLRWGGKLCYGHGCHWALTGPQPGGWGKHFGMIIFAQYLEWSQCTSWLDEDSESRQWISQEIWIFLKHHLLQRVRGFKILPWKLTFWSQKWVGLSRGFSFSMGEIVRFSWNVPWSNPLHFQAPTWSPNSSRPRFPAILGEDIANP